jgi:hypothetical protein
MNDGRGFGHMVMISSMFKQRNHAVILYDVCWVRESIFTGQKRYNWPPEWPKGGYDRGPLCILLRHWFRMRRHEPAIVILISNRGGGSILLQAIQFNSKLQIELNWIVKSPGSWWWRLVEITHESKVADCRMGRNGGQKVVRPPFRFLWNYDLFCNGGSISIPLGKELGPWNEHFIS